MKILWEPTREHMGIAHDDKYLFVIGFCCSKCLVCAQPVYKCIACGKKYDVNNYRWNTRIPLALFSTETGRVGFYKWFKDWTGVKDMMVYVVLDD